VVVVSILALRANSTDGPLLYPRRVGRVAGGPCLWNDHCFGAVCLWFGSRLSTFAAVCGFPPAEGPRCAEIARRPQSFPHSLHAFSAAIPPVVARRPQTFPSGVFWL